MPEGFFEQFNQQLVDSLPEVQITNVDEKPSMWVRVRPYLYMAATFAGIWAMMNVFNHFNGTTDQTMRMNEIAAGISQDNNADELIMSGVASDYDILTYEDSVNNDMANEVEPELPK